MGVAVPTGGGFLVASSKKGVSSNQLHRMLGISLKSAWFMSHRIREAMRGGDLAPFGADGGVVEVDETYIGHDKKGKRKRRPKGKPDNPAQSRRFIEAAKALGVDESHEAFDKTLRKLLKPKVKGHGSK